MWIWKDYTYYLFLSYVSLVSIVVICILNIITSVAMKRAARAIENQGDQPTSCKSKNGVVYKKQKTRIAEQRITKLVLVISIVFTVCSLPSVIGTNLAYFCIIGQKFKNSLDLPFLINSFSNPLIYLAREKKFKRTVKVMFGCKARRNRISSESDDSTSKQTSKNFESSCRTEKHSTE